MKREHNTAIVLAAGRGSRMNSQVQKQFIEIGGKPVIYYSLLQFERFEPVDEIILVTGEAQIAYCRSQIVEAFGFHKVSRIVAGGEERYHSVYNGLQAAENSDYVFIHDGARPFLDQELLKRAMESVRVYKACVVGMPAKDTIKLADARQFAEQTPDRGRVWTVQTPQVFSFSLIRSAYDKLMTQNIRQVTDDAMVLEQMEHYPVKLVEGSYKNIKITTPEDLLIAEAFLQKPRCKQQNF